MEITFEDFTKVELKVGTILGISRIPKSDKLLKLVVDLGDLIPENEQQEPTAAEGKLSNKKFRTVLAGVGKSFKEEDLIGKQFLFVTNLRPRKMMGETSEAMILAVGSDAEHLSLLTTTANVEPGSGAK